MEINQFFSKRKFHSGTWVVIALVVWCLPGLSLTAPSMGWRLSGRILLQVQDKGQAWYVSPTDLRRYSLGSPTNAYNVMRTLGLGITNANLARVPEYRKGGGDVNFAKNLSGRILLQVEDKGKAWYVSPVNLQRYYLGSPAQAYQLMRNLGLGVTTANLEQIPLYRAASTSVPKIAGCSIYPDDNPWNADISDYPVHSRSSTYINSISPTAHLHADFGEDQGYGIPYNVVDAKQADVPITFTAYGDESDPGPYPIPASARVEAGSDQHVLVLDSATCWLYEMYNARRASSGSGWLADAGAVFDLNSNKLRPSGWTSADAAGLPILPGLVRYDEVAAGEINHALRFTARLTQEGWIEPATHQAGKNNNDYPPMGLRVRLKSSYDLSGYYGQARVILEALKKYGLILADNGSSWFITGAPDPRWNDDDLNQLKKIPGSAFEAVYTGEIKH